MTFPVQQGSFAFPWNTERLTIRPFITEDLDDVYTLCSHPDICRFIRPAMTMEEVQQHIIDRLPPWELEDMRWYSMSVLEKDQSRVIGELVFRIESSHDQRAEIGYRFHPDAQGKGYAREANLPMFRMLFEELGLNKLVAYIDNNNEPSKRLVERLGMKQEGLRFKHQFSQINGWVDMAEYGLLASDFEP